MVQQQLADRPEPLTGLVFAYAVMLAFWAVGRFTRAPAK